MPPDTAREVVRTYWREFVSIRQLARRYGVSHMSVWRLVNSSPRPV